MIIALAAYLFAVWAVAMSEAKTDAANIKAGVRIDHGKQWRERASIIVVAAVVSTIWLSFWSIPGLLMIGAFGFSGLFRSELNKLRGLSPYYISPSNYYDTFFLWVVNRRTVKDEDYNINGAGRLAYKVEMALVCAGVAWVLLTIF